MTRPLLAAAGVTKHLAGRAVLRDARLAVAPGEACALVGANGAGKSTLLRIVAGVLDAERGEITIDGASLRRDRRRALAALGYVPERPDIPEHLRAIEWLDLVAALKRTPRLDAADAQTLGLDTYVHQRVGSLSLGQHRKIALAAARLGAPRVLALDEPSNGLDEASVALLARTLRAHVDAGGAVLVATHDAAFAERLGARVVRIEGGALR